jgi:hypothetical protein
MLILVGVSLATAAGFLFGGKIGRLGGVRVVWWWAGLAAFAAQNAAIGVVRGMAEGPAIALLVGSHVALVLVALLNTRLPGARVVLVGLAMNLACMLANGGLMPIAPETLAMTEHAVEWRIGAGTAGTWLQRSKDVILPADQTNLALLSDRYVANLPGGLSRVFSVGDVLLVAGMSMFVFAIMTKESRDAEQTSRELAPARLAVVPAAGE